MTSFPSSNDLRLLICVRASSSFVVSFDFLTLSSLLLNFWLVHCFVDDTLVPSHVLFDVAQHIFRVLAP
jgi:hypothetical protein